MTGLYKVEAGYTPDQSKPRVEEDVCLAVWFEAVTDLARHVSLNVLVTAEVCRCGLLTGHLVSQGGAVALQAGHAVRDVLSILLSDSPVGNYVDNYYVVVLVQQHLVRCRLLPVPLRPDLHPVIEADDGAGLDVCNDCLSVPTLCVDVSPVLANSPWPASLILLCLTSTKMAS